MSAMLTRVDRAAYRALLPLAVALDTVLLPSRAAAALSASGAPLQPPLPLPPAAPTATLPSALAYLRACFRGSTEAAQLPLPAADGLAALRAVNASLRGAGMHAQAQAQQPRGALLRCLGSARPSALPLPLPAGGAHLVAPSAAALSPGTLLLARPALPAPFTRAVVLLLHHSDEGAVGVTLSALGPAAGGPAPSEPQQPPFSLPLLPALAHPRSWGPAAPATVPPRLTLDYHAPPTFTAALHCSSLPARYLALLRPTGAASCAARASSPPCASLPSLRTAEQRFWASASAQFSRCNAEGALGALRAAGLSAFPHKSGLRGLVAAPRAGDGTGSALQEVALPPLGPGLDAPAPSWVAAAQGAWRAPAAWHQAGAQTAEVWGAQAASGSGACRGGRTLSQVRHAAARYTGRRWFGRRTACISVAIAGKELKEVAGVAVLDARSEGGSTAAFAAPLWSDSDAYGSSSDEEGTGGVGVGTSAMVEGLAEEEDRDDLRSAAGLISELRSTLSALVSSDDGPRGWKLRRAARRLRGLAESEQEACERVEQSLAKGGESEGSSLEEGSSEEEEEGEGEGAEDGAEEEEEEEMVAEMRAAVQGLGEESAAAAARTRAAAPFPGPSSSWGARSASPLCPRAVARHAALTSTHALLPLELTFPAALRTPSQAGLLALCLATGRLNVLGAAARALAPSQAKAIGRQMQAAAAGAGGGKGGSADCAAAPTEQPPPALYGGPVPSRVFSLRPGAAAAGGGFGGAGTAAAPPGRGRVRGAASAQLLRGSSAPAAPSQLAMFLGAGSGLPQQLAVRPWQPGEARAGHYFSSVASWAPGQLDAELREEAWYAVRVEDVWGAVAQGCGARGSGAGGSGRGGELWQRTLRQLGGLYALVAETDAAGARS